METNEKYKLIFKERHGNRYTYENMVYTGAKNKVSITCRLHGDFELRVEQHKAGKGCKVCNKTSYSRLKGSSQDKFITMANNIHKGKYLYNKVVYVNNTSPVIISCQEHGDFLQKPCNHIGGNGCQLCDELDKASGRHLKDMKYYLPLINKVHNNKYKIHLNTFEYKGCKEHIPVECPIHGIFYASPDNLSRGKGCNKCGIDSTTSKLTYSHEQFIERSREIHDNKYSYDKVNYTSASGLVTITCPIHGDFEQALNSHSYGRGCTACGKRNSGLWSLTRMLKDVEYYDSRECHLYLLDITTPLDERLFKIGITTGFDKRFDLMFKEGVTINKVVSTIKSTMLQSLILEREFKKTFSSSNLEAKYKFGGYTECFTPTKDFIDKAISFFNQASS